MRIRFLIAAALLLSLLGCGSADTPTQAAATPSSADAEPLASPEPGATLSLDQQSVAALERLALWLQTDTQLSVASIEATTWDSAALGCPAPGASYAQMLTPGALVKITSAPGTEYEVHTSDDGMAVLCENALPTDLPATSSSQEAPPMAMDIQTLAHTVVGLHAQNFSVDQETITVLSSDEVTWSSGALGCPQPGMMYTTVLSPGFRVLIEQGGTEFAYHAGKNGEFFLCENPQAPVAN